MAGRIGRWGAALVLGGLWWVAVLRLAFSPGAGVLEGTVAAGGWGLSVLPVHCVPRGRARRADAGSAGGREWAGSGGPYGVEMRDGYPAGPYGPGVRGGYPAGPHGSEVRGGYPASWGEPPGSGGELAEPWEESPASWGEPPGSAGEPPGVWDEPRGR